MYACMQADILDMQKTGVAAKNFVATNSTILPSTDGYSNILGHGTRKNQ